MTPVVFKHRFTVPPSAIDALDHVNSVVYLQWCLETAEAHWVSKTDDRLREKYVWVVLNHYITYKAPSFEGETLETHTWIESYKGLKCERRYKIVRPGDNKILVEAKTLWCLLDAKTHRPTKITEEISTLFV